MLKKFKIYLALTMTFTFAFQNMIYAKEIQNLSYNDILVEQYVKDIKAGIKYKDLYGKIVVKNSKDKELVKDILDKHGEELVMAPIMNGKVMTFKLGEVSVNVEFTDILNEKVTINGYAADLKKYSTLTEKLEYISRVLKTNPVNAHSVLPTKNPIILLFYPLQAHAIFPAIYILYLCVGVNAIAWYRAYREMHPDNKPFINLADNLLSESKRCIEKNGLETLTAKVEAEFSCKENVLNIKVDGKNCFSSTDEGSKKSSLALAAKKCCSEDKANCESTFKSAFPKAESSRVEKRSNGQGYNYIGN